MYYRRRSHALTMRHHVRLVKEIPRALQQLRFKSQFKDDDTDDDLDTLVEEAILRREAR